MKKKSMIALFLLLLMTAGCGNSYEDYDKNVIKFEKDGGVTETIQEAFDETLYDEEGLEVSIEEELASYNSQFGTEVVSMKKCRVKDGEAFVVMEYQTAEDFSEFNHVAVFDGTISEFVESEYHAYVDLRDLDGVVTPLNFIVASDASYYVAVVDRDCIVEIPGTICYVSGQADVISKKAANVTVEDEIYAYIVYK